MTTKEQIELERKIDELCPTGYVFLTNISYGMHLGEDVTNYYQWFISNLRNNKYIIQVADAITVFGEYFSTPTYQHLAIYVKRVDGKKVVLNEVWKAVDKGKNEKNGGK